MRKKMVATLLMCGLIACTGCQKTEESVSKEISYADMIPNPVEVFPNANLTITDNDGGDAYMFNITGYTQSEFEEYVELCKGYGFTNYSYDTETDYGAYSEDGKYWIQVNNDVDNGVIYIICQKSRNYKEDAAQ